LWIVDIYGFLLAGLLITMGTLGDKIGRRKLLLIGAATFGAASVFAANASTPNMLIVARGVLGIAGATLAPSTLSLIRNMFADPKQRTVAIGVWITSFSVGGAIGPVLGGIVLQSFSWGAVFLLSLPVMVLLLLAGPRLLPEYRNPQAGKIDLVSVVLSLVSLLTIIYCVKNMVQEGINGSAVTMLALGIGLLLLFIKRQKRLAHPLLDLRLFSYQDFRLFLGMYTLCTFVLFGMFLFVAQYLQLVLGLSPLQAGLWGLPSAFGFIVGSMSTPLITKSIKPISITLIGLLVAAAGFSLLLFLKGDSDLILLVSAFSLFSIGTSPVFTLATDFIVGSSPPERAGTAASLSETGSELGGALGIAILGSIGAFVYRTMMHDYNFLSANHSATSIESLGGAIVSSVNIPTDQAEQLTSYARSAFTTGLHWAAGLSTLITLTLAFLCFVYSKKKSKNELR